MTHQLGFQFHSNGVDMTVVARRGLLVGLQIGKLANLSDANPVRIFYKTDEWVSDRVAEEANRIAHNKEKLDAAIHHDPLRA